MANKIETFLRSYKHDSVENKETRKITWWVMDSEEGTGRAFTEEEKELFILYIVSCPENFPGAKNLVSMNGEKVALIDKGQNLHGKKQEKVIVLRKRPLNESIADITLCPVHTYYLPFTVIGKFQD